MTLRAANVSGGKFIKIAVTNTGIGIKQKTTN